MDLSIVIAAGGRGAAINEDEASKARLAGLQEWWMALGSTFFLYGLIAWLLSEDARPGDWWLHGAWCIGGGGWRRLCYSRQLQKGFGQSFGTILLCSRVHSHYIF